MMKMPSRYVLKTNKCLLRYVYDFSVDYDSIEVDDILDFCEYLMK